MIYYKKLQFDDLHSDCFVSFHHDQHWENQWVKLNGKWALISIKGSRSWSLEKRIWMSKYIREQIENGGFAIGAFHNKKIIGFIAVDGKIIDSYANLTLLFVDDSFHRNGIGKSLVKQACFESAMMGAKKLFISAIPSETTISFYFSVGCKDAETIIREFVDTENDRYLELNLL